MGEIMRLELYNKSGKTFVDRHLPTIMGIFNSGKAEPDKLPAAKTVLKSPNPIRDFSEAACKLVIFLEEELRAKRAAALEQRTGVYRFDLKILEPKLKPLEDRIWDISKNISPVYIMTSSELAALKQRLNRDYKGGVVTENKLTDQELAALMRDIGKQLGINR